MKKQRNVITVRLNDEDLLALNQLLEKEKTKNPDATRSSVIIDAIKTQYALKMNQYGDNIFLETIQNVFDQMLDGMYRANAENLQTAYEKTNDNIDRQNEKLWLALKLLLSKTEFADSHTASALAVNQNYAFEKYIDEKIK